MEEVNSYSGVSIVVPVYKSLSTLEVLVNKIQAVLDGQRPYEIILVDDGSPKETWSEVTRLAHIYPSVKGIRLGRNFGQHNALVAGIRTAKMPLTLTLDDDLQNPPEEIPRLLSELEEQDLDVVYGVPDRMEQAFTRRMAGKITRYALRGGLGIAEAPSVSSFRAFRTQTRDAFASDIGTNVSLDALLTWGSARFGSITVKHDARSEGTSNYSFAKLLRFAMDTTTGYSTAPLQFTSILGILIAVLGFVSLIWIVGRPLVTGQSVPGFPFLAATITIFSGAQLATLGIIGEYLARMHFRIMRKPTYVVADSTFTKQEPGYKDERPT